MPPTTPTTPTPAEAAEAATDAAAGDVPAYCETLTHGAVAASRALAAAPGRQRDRALGHIAQALLESTDTLKSHNARDLEAGREAGLSEAMLDRLLLDDARIDKMAASVRQIADQRDPVGRVIEGRVLGNGIRLQKLRVPIGVVLIIFESRPNVTSDAAALCVKSGNAVILRGGKEARHTNAAIADRVSRGLEAAGIDPRAVQLVQTPDRAAVTQLLGKQGRIDLCIPRGGESLIRAVVEQARIPVIKHYTGNCHVYLDAGCDPAMAQAITLNAKTQRPGVCNAAETILVHKDTADTRAFVELVDALLGRGVTLRADDAARRRLGERAGIEPATDDDWAAEYLDKIVALKVVGSIDDAIDHINRFGSRHTDAIVTERLDAADAFVQRVDSANVMVNCSTRFSDGNEYGLGAEIGISTDKLHARGPMGAEDLTTYKWVAHGRGQIRE